MVALNNIVAGLFATLQAAWGFESSPIRGLDVMNSTALHNTSYYSDVCSVGDINSSMVCSNPIVFRHDFEYSSTIQHGYSAIPLPKQSVRSAALIVATILMVWRAMQKKKKVKVTDLFIYPIKSCAAQQVETARVTPRGFKGDRILQLVDSEGWMMTETHSDWVELNRFSPNLNGCSLVVTSPSMKTPLEIDLSTANERKEIKCYDEDTSAEEARFYLEDQGDTAAQWFEDALGWEDTHLVGVGRRFARYAKVDTQQNEPLPTKAPPLNLSSRAPYLLASMASLRDLNYRLEARGRETVDMSRFRPNIVIDGLKAWEEDSLRRIRIGKVQFHVWQRCARCVCVGVDPKTKKTGAEPVATLNTFRERSQGVRNFGMYLIPVEGSIASDVESSVSRGDEIEILEYDHERREEWERLFSKSALKEWEQTYRKQERKSLSLFNVL